MSGSLLAPTQRRRLSWKLPLAASERTRGEFEGAEFEVDADAAPLLLKRCAKDAELLVGGSFQREVEGARHLFRGETRGIEKLFRAGGVERVLRDVRFVGPVIGRKNAAGDTGLAVNQIADERLAVGSIGQGLANFAAFEDGVFEVEARGR